MDIKLFFYFFIFICTKIHASPAIGFIDSSSDSIFIYTPANIKGIGTVFSQYQINGNLFCCKKYKAKDLIQDEETESRVSDATGDSSLIKIHRYRIKNGNENYDRFYGLALINVILPIYSSKTRITGNTGTRLFSASKCIDGEGIRFTDNQSKRSYYYYFGYEVDLSTTPKKQLCN